MTYNEPFFAGHFPTEPVMPGVLIMEAMAQTTAVLLMNREEMRGKIGYYGAMNKVRFRKKSGAGNGSAYGNRNLKTKRTCGRGHGKSLYGRRSCRRR